MGVKGGKTLIKKKKSFCNSDHEALPVPSTDLE